MQIISQKDHRLDPQTAISEITVESCDNLTIVSKDKLVLDMEISMPAPEVNLWLKPGIGVPRVPVSMIYNSKVLRSLNLIWCVVKRFTRKGKKICLWKRRVEKNRTKLNANIHEIVSWIRFDRNNNQIFFLKYYSNYILLTFFICNLTNHAFRYGNIFFD